MAFYLLSYYKLLLERQSENLYTLRLCSVLVFNGRQHEDVQLLIKNTLLLHLRAYKDFPFQLVGCPKTPYMIF